MEILTFDFGGSAVKYGVWNGSQLHSKGSFTTPESWEKMKAALLEVFQKQETKLKGVAFSAPGVVDAQAKMIKGISAIPYIHHFNIYDELEELFQLPVTFENDANCAGLAEVYAGVAKGKKEVAFVVIGTGIGGAIFHEGKIVKGSHLFGGEFGLMYLDQGKTFSELGTAVQMAWRYCEEKGVAKDTYSGKQVFELAEAGDASAQAEVEKFYDYLTKGLFGIQFSLDPEMIIIGGGVSSKEGLLEELNSRMKMELERFGLKDFVPEIVTCAYQNDANLIGAAANFVIEMK